jgi:hypothetical protein
LKKNYFSSHKLPKQQSTSFWSQEILGVKDCIFTENYESKHVRVCAREPVHQIIQRKEATEFVIPLYSSQSSSEKAGRVGFQWLNFRDFVDDNNGGLQ